MSPSSPLASPSPDDSDGSMSTVDGGRTTIVLGAPGVESMVGGVALGEVSSPLGGFVVAKMVGSEGRDRIVGDDAGGSTGSGTAGVADGGGAA